MGSEPPIENRSKSGGWEGEQSGEESFLCPSCFNRLECFFLVLPFCDFVFRLEALIRLGLTEPRSDLAQQVFADFFCVKELESNLPCRFRVLPVVVADLGKAPHCFLKG